LSSFDELLASSGGFKGVFASIRKSGQNLEKEVEGFLRGESGLFSLAQFSVKRLDTGVAEISFPFSETVARHGGIVHGGIISFALDTVGGLACMANNPGVDQVTIALTINFLKPLKKEPFRALGKELRSGRTTAVAEAEMRDGDDELCAVALGTWYKILKPRE
jgi:uncharacterized protein (TIGR00369 family)